MKLSDTTSTPPAILLWGPYGSGKTAFCQTGGSLVQIVDLDNGAKTGLYLKDRWHPQRVLSDWEPMLDTPGNPGIAFENLEAHVTSIPSKIAAGKYPYKVFVLDSLTTCCDAAMNLTLRQNGNTGGNPTQPQWGLAMIKVKQILHKIRVLPICKIVIAHEDMDVVGGITTIKPKVMGNKLYPEIPPLFDEILYAKKVQLSGDTAEYRLHTKSTSFYSARTRYNIPDYNMDNGLGELLKLMNYPLEVPSVK